MSSISARVVPHVQQGHRKHLPNALAAVLPRALVKEAIDLCDLPALVVSPQDGDPLPVPDLEAKQQ